MIQGRNYRVFYAFLCLGGANFDQIRVDGKVPTLRCAIRECRVCRQLCVEITRGIINLICILKQNAVL